MKPAPKTRCIAAGQTTMNYYKNMEDTTPKGCLDLKGAHVEARPSLIPSLCTHFTRAEIVWRR